MVVKVSGYCLGLHVIGRPLHRCKGIDFLPNGKHHNSSRVLSGGPSYPHTALHNPVNLTISLVDAPFLVIPLHIPKSSFICQSTDCPGTEGLSLPKDHLRVIVSLTLIFSGKIQVNIRLLVPLKAQKGLKRNVKPCLHKRCIALRTFPVRHVAACHTAELPYLLRIKIIKVTVRAIIMGA